MTQRSTSTRIVHASIVAVVMVLLGAVMGFCQEANQVNTKPTAAQATEATEWTTDLRSAVKNAVRTDRPMMLLFTGTDWCIWCQRLEQEVFATPEFSEWSDDNVVKVMVNFPQSFQLDSKIAKQNKLLKEKYKSLVTSYPTVLFVNTDGSVIAKTGYQAGGAQNWIANAGSLLPAKVAPLEAENTMIAGNVINE